MQAGRTLVQSMLWRGLYYITAFIINILIARHFQASVSGFIYYISSIYALGLLLSSLSIESGIIYFAAKGEIAVGKLYNFSIAWSLIIGLISFFTVYLFFGDSYAGISKTLLIVSSVSFIFGNLLTTYCSAFFYARQNFIVPNCINIICTVLLIALIPYNGKSIIPAITDENYFYIYFCSFFVQGICMAVAAKIKYIKRDVQRFLSLAEFKILFRYCVLAFTGNIIYFLLYRVDYFFVEKYCSADQLGNYIQVSKLGQLLILIPSIMATVIFPYASNQASALGLDKLQLLCRLLCLLFIPITLVLVLSGNWFFPWLFGKGFTQMYPAMLYYLLGFFALSIVTLLAAYLAGKAKLKYNFLASALALLVVIVGDILLIPTYGITAAAAVSSTAYFICMLYLLWVYQKKMQTSWKYFFFTRKTDIKTLTAILKK